MALAQLCTDRAPTLAACGAHAGRSRPRRSPNGCRVDRGAPATHRLNADKPRSGRVRNLYKIWNRMSSGTFPPPVLRSSVGYAAMASSNSGPMFRSEPTLRSTGHTRSSASGAGRQQRRPVLLVQDHRHRQNWNDVPSVSFLPHDNSAGIASVGRLSLDDGRLRLGCGRCLLLRLFARCGPSKGSRRIPGWRTG